VPDLAKVLSSFLKSVSPFSLLQNQNIVNKKGLIALTPRPSN
jgi:hypothetical protein